MVMAGARGYTRPTHGKRNMADHETPHFHNQPGVPKVKIGAQRFMCIGALPPFDHPHIFIDMGQSDETVCPYCSTRYVYDATLKGHSDPTECEYRPTA